MDKADQIISILFDKVNPSESRNYTDIFKRWKTIVQDDRLADHCRLEDIQGHSIRVSFDHPGWIQLFKMNQSEIINRLNRQYAGLNISSVSMHLRDEKFNLPPVKTRNKDIPETEDAGVKDIKTSLNDIKDEDLKSILKNLRKTLNGK